MSESANLSSAMTRDIEREEADGPTVRPWSLVPTFVCGIPEDSGHFQKVQLVEPSLDSSFQGYMRNFSMQIIPFNEIESYSQEMSGMLGDLGLYIPIVVSLSLKGQIDLGTTLITTGLCNIMTALFFKTPMCVQPMKSIAASAITYKLTEPQIMASGLITSFIITGLGLTNMIEVCYLIIPHAAVRGLQIGLGMKLFQNALQMLPDSMSPSWREVSWIRFDGYLFALVCLVFCLVGNKSKRVPTAFILFIVGIITASFRLIKTNPNPVLFKTVTSMHTVSISSNDWAVAAVYGAIPQVPTTLLNSVIAVVKLNQDLYPTNHAQKGVTLVSVATSVGLMNILFCWFGGYPMCHGSGGLAGQHRFGARTNLSILVLGVCKLILGIFFGAGLLQVLRYFPDGILAVLLAIASVELAISGRSGLQGTSEEARICMLTALFVCFWDQGTGILIGIISSYIITVTELFVGSDDEKHESRRKFRLHLEALRDSIYKAFCGNEKLSQPTSKHAKLPSSASDDIIGGCRSDTM